MKTTTTKPSAINILAHFFPYVFPNSRTTRAVDVKKKNKNILSWWLLLFADDGSRTRIAKTYLSYPFVYRFIPEVGTRREDETALIRFTKHETCVERDKIIDSIFTCCRFFSIPSRPLLIVSNWIMLIIIIIFLRRILKRENAI